MREHTTHHADCGCLTAKHEAELSSLRAKLAEVTARLRECEGALEPFRDMYAEFQREHPEWTDSAIIYSQFTKDGPREAITLGNLRRAASLLRPPERSDEGGPLAGAGAQPKSLPVEVVGDCVNHVYQWGREQEAAAKLAGMQEAAEIAREAAEKWRRHTPSEVRAGQQYAALDIKSQIEARMEASRARAQKGGE